MSGPTECFDCGSPQVEEREHDGNFYWRFECGSTYALSPLGERTVRTQECRRRAERKDGGV